MIVGSDPHIFDQFRMFRRMISAVWAKSAAFGRRIITTQTPALAISAKITEVVKSRS